MEIPKYVNDILDLLEENQEAAYIVGGSLRDSLLGLSPNDYDVATSALPEKTREIFIGAGKKVIDTGIKHGTVTVLWNSHPVEITTFRIDGSYTDARHPDGVSFTDRIEEDLSRRDFTVNAMAYSPKRGFVDVFGGREDLAAGILRAVREPSERFREDALRILRAYRFSAQLGFSIEEKTAEAAVVCKDGIAMLSAERVFTELYKLLEAKCPEAALYHMKQNGILSYVLAEYLPSDSLIGLVGRVKGSGAARLGFLLGDADEDTARAILAGLKCSNKQKAEALAIRRAMGFEISCERDVGKLRALSGDYSLFAVSALVAMGKAPADAESWLAKSRAPSSTSDLAVSGRDIMALGARGAEIGETMKKLLDAAIDAPELNEREALLALAKKILASHS